MTEFKKGDAVHLIQSWDRRGTVAITAAIVHSCGKKQMVLTSATSGKELGRHFWPVGKESLDPGQQRGGGFTTKETERAKVEALALGFAAEILAWEREHFARCLAGNHGAGYDAAIVKERDQLHEAAVLWVEG